MKVCILGRQPALSLVEIESLVGAPNIQQLGREAALVDDATHPLQQDLLGGTLKIGEVVATIDDASSEKAFARTRDWFADELGRLPEGKISLGVSVYGHKSPPANVQKFALSLKKIAKNAGRSLRVVPNKTAALGTAQVLHNGLTSERNVEILMVADGHKIVIARTISVQNIDDYSRRDYGRPKRDAFVGMLPPKLAQIMLNIAGAQAGQTVLDPFCGTGVLLQEAALRGCNVQGTDLSEKMVRYTRDNLGWLSDSRQLAVEKYFEVADATTATWRQPIDVVACEGFLGQPLSGLPKPEKMHEIIQNCDEIMRGFLQNMHPQLTPGTRLCIAAPAWHTKNGFLHLPVVDQLEEIGYNRVSFTRASNAELVYHRPDQIVARQLLALTRK